MDLDDFLFSSSSQNICLVELSSDSVQAGFVGASQPVVTVDVAAFCSSFPVPLWQNERQTDPRHLSELHCRLYDILDYAFTYKLLVNAVDQRVVVCERQELSRPVRTVVRDVVLADLHCQSIVFYPAAIMFALGAGSRDALVLDVSHAGSCLTAVCDLRVIAPNLLSKRGTRTNDLFAHEPSTDDDDNADLCTLVLDMCVKLDRDLVAPLLRNLLVIGVSAQIAKMLQSKLVSHFSVDSCVQPCLKATLGAWQGLSLYISSVAWSYGAQHMLPNEISRDTYLSYDCSGQ